LAPAAPAVVCDALAVRRRSNMERLVLQPRAMRCDRAGAGRGAARVVFSAAQRLDPRCHRQHEGDAGAFLVADALAAKRRAISNGSMLCAIATCAWAWALGAAGAREIAAALSGSSTLRECSARPVMRWARSACAHCSFAVANGGATVPFVVLSDNDVGAADTAEFLHRLAAMRARATDAEFVCRSGRREVVSHVADLFSS
jgi:hypothetical protein